MYFIQSRVSFQMLGVFFFSLKWFGFSFEYPFISYFISYMENLLIYFQGHPRTIALLREKNEFLRSSFSFVYIYQMHVYVVYMPMCTFKCICVYPYTYVHVQRIYILSYMVCILDIFKNKTNPFFYRFLVCS